MTSTFSKISCDRCNTENNVEAKKCKNCGNHGFGWSCPVYTVSGNDNNYTGSSCTITQEDVLRTIEEVREKFKKAKTALEEASQYGSVAGEICKRALKEIED